MTTPEEIFAQMASKYVPGRISADRTYYFSVGGTRRTVRLTPRTCTVDDGRTIDNADCVLKADPKLFVAMVTKGKMPGPIDIARGKIKTNDVGMLGDLAQLFEF